LISLLLSAALLLVVPRARSAGSLNVSLASFATGLSSPVDIANAGDSRLFVVERAGYIRIVQSNGTVVGTPFLDIASRVFSSGSEQGLLGLAFHPDYASNGYFYVYYTRDHATGSLDGDLVIARYSVTANPNVADPSSEVILLVVDHLNGQSNHNGGNLEFGPDGYLYIGTGDGGGGGDPSENGQDLTDLQGKLLRIDVDGGAGNAPDCGMQNAVYTVPAGNPYDDGAGGDCDEIWHWGLRNPWRFSFDSLTADLWIGDVGQNLWEEINHQPAASAGGENWGWDCYEGNHLYADGSPGIPCGSSSNYDFPVQEYDHSGSRCSVTGGYVYRGAQYPELYGHYLYADYCSGEFWTLTPAGGGNWTLTTLGDLGGGFTTFGEDADGELYTASGSTIWHIEEDTLATPSPTPGASATPTGSPTPSATPTQTATPTITPTPTAITPTATPFPNGAPFAVNLIPAAGGFDQPTFIGSAGGALLYVGERAGQVWSFDPAGRGGAALFLDIADRVDDTGFQEGLLGIAFHPDFANNGYFYVNYTDHFSSTIVSRFTYTGTLPVGGGSEHLIFTLPQPYPDNNGGGLAFDADGYLYIALGDGGGAGDPNELAQDLLDLHGKILRLDVDGGGSPADCGSGDYTIPAGNPFSGAGACDEIWLYGFRNIWGMTFDADTDDLWIADVGDQLSEEINFQAAGSAGGENYGWSCYEGTLEGPNYSPADCTDTYTFPALEIDHSLGRSVTGGYVYRGAAYPFMDGYYFFADFVLGRLWTLHPASGSVVEHYAFFGSFSAFGQAADGTLYVADYGSGTIYRIEGVELFDANLPVIRRDP
jgi:glucose/arabinose dehydrogenase